MTQQIDITEKVTETLEDTIKDIYFLGSGRVSKNRNDEDEDGTRKRPELGDLEQSLCTVPVTF